MILKFLTNTSSKCYIKIVNFIQNKYKYVNILLIINIAVLILPKCKYIFLFIHIICYVHSHSVLQNKRSFTVMIMWNTETDCGDWTHSF